MGATVKKIRATNLADVTPVKLKSHPNINEAWLQETIAESPKMLGLGDLELIQRERRQPQGGRLDLLLADSDGGSRYEVELQLGTTDESHIIRCIEYWDVERRRYPAYEHTAVLVAEDVTSRFLNVMSLFAGNIPLIVLQLSAFEVEGKLALTFIKVLDQATLREDDESERDLEVRDRSYWVKSASEGTVKVAEDCLGILNEHSAQQFGINHCKNYLGLTDGTKTTRFVFFKPKKNFTNVVAKVGDVDQWIERFEENSVPARRSRKSGKIVVTLTKDRLQDHRGLISDFFAAVVKLNE